MAGPLKINAPPIISMPARIHMKMPQLSPAMIKITEPNKGRFQDIIKAMDNTKTGILWIKNPAMIIYHTSSISKTSNDSMNIITISRIESTLGVHKMSLCFNTTHHLSFQLHFTPKYQICKISLEIKKRCVIAIESFQKMMRIKSGAEKMIRSLYICILFSIPS